MIEDEIAAEGNRIDDGLRPRLQRAPSTITDRYPRCKRCEHLLAELCTRPWVIKCRHCKHRNIARGPVQDTPGMGDPTTL